MRKVGAAKAKKVDVRIMAATAKNLAQEVQDGHFREDLFYRLNVINIHIPPLRERIMDVPLLCEYFMGKFSRGRAIELQGLSPEALQILLHHSWPGNVRELENIMERAAVLAEQEVIQPENFPEHLVGRKDSQRFDLLLGTISIKKGRKIMEQKLIDRALEITSGNKSKAALLLEVSYPSLLHKIKEYRHEL